MMFKIRERCEYTASCARDIFAGTALHGPCAAQPSNVLTSAHTGHIKQGGAGLHTFLVAHLFHLVPPLTPFSFVSVMASLDKHDAAAAVDEDAPGQPISVPDASDTGESGKLKMIVQLVKKCLGVKDIAAMYVFSALFSSLWFLTS